MIRRIRWKISMVVFTGIVILAEIGLAMASPFFWRARDKAELISPELFKDQLDAWQEQDEKTLLVLGDSVFYGSALQAAGVKEWRLKTPVQGLRASRCCQAWQVVDLSADGVMPLDLEALWSAGKVLKPAAAVIELNYRMFSSQAGTASGASAYPWLSQWAPSTAADNWNEVLAAAVEKAAKEANTRLDDNAELEARTQKMVLQIARRSHLFRYTELGRILLWAPSPNHVFGQWIDRVFPAKDDELEDALLAYKVRPYYNGPAMSPEHLGRLALSRLLDDLRASSIPVLIFLTPQNISWIEDFVDEDAWKDNLKWLKSRVKPGGNVTLFDWSKKEIKGEFLDHCHLDPAGNEWLAQELLEVIGIE